MQTLKGLFGIFHTGPGTVDDCVTACKGFGEIAGIVGVQSEKRCTCDRLGVAAVLPAGDGDDFMTAGNQITRQMSPNKTGSTSNGYFHNAPSAIAKSPGCTFAERYPERFPKYINH